MMKKLHFPPLIKLRRARASRGQSLVELTLVLGVLLLLLLGVVEYGFLLNRYLNFLDAAREAARQGSLMDPFIDVDGDGIASDLDMRFFGSDPDLPISANNPFGVADWVEDIARPVEMDATLGDDIVISFFSVAGSSARRFPDADGWSRHGNEVSRFTTTQILALMDSAAPATGVLLVEVFYNYPQVLNVPLISNVIPNPIPVYTYAIMPLSGAEPTPTH